ncbi:uncharacterized protein LOC118434661 [Folsomia candida]|nr:uncharacterized protein LOC118434661 [Folsomia candida]
MDHTRVNVVSDFIKGVIFGAALGDAVGLATEFMNKDKIRILYGVGPIKFGKSEGHAFWRDFHRRRWHDNDFTDDTDQLLLILQCLLHSNGILIPQHFAYRLKEWVEIGFPELDKVAAGIGLTVGSTLRHPDFLSNPSKAAFQIWEQYDRNMAANGAVMRTSGIGIPYFWSEEKVVTNAINCAKVTHADPRCVFSSVVATVIISRMLSRSSYNDEKLNVSEFKDLFRTLMESGCTDDNKEHDAVPSIEPKPIIKQEPVKTSLISKLKTMFTGNKDPRLQHKFPQNWPLHKEPDNSRMNNEPINNVTSATDNFGCDPDLVQLINDVVEDYRFLLRESTPLSTEEKGIEWEGDMEKYCLNMSSKKLKDFELDEPKSIGYTFKCLGSALFCFSRKIPDNFTHGDFFTQVITDLTLEGGDADTNCAVAGAFLGVRMGYSGLPKNWKKEVRNFDFLDGICNDLHNMMIQLKQET